MAVVPRMQYIELLLLQDCAVQGLTVSPQGKHQDVHCCFALE